ncbi:hypothetical protein DMC30DRAFT_104444 [Rhodotorula diobovata]|uniref:Uncharacterized protein n=1 Tax=Rhodotorula diobovata TaxID=5288 RepID=A0A5C5FNP9_9BASI|nr:hypothetical protein DMC30DRAFT_104444 [Rhodotorula diobovata]
MFPEWTYSTTCRALPPAESSLSLAASSSSTSSPDSLLASTTPTVHLRVTADSQELDSLALSRSAVVREVHDWLDRNKASIAVDKLGQSEVSDEGITIPLHAFSRSSHASLLSLPPQAEHDSDDREGEVLDPPRLASLTLSLDFHSSGTARPRKKPRRAPSLTPPDSPVRSSQPQTQPVPGITLASQLLSPVALHFTLASLLDAALTRFVKKLVVAFPLCFNARWIDVSCLDATASRPGWLIAHARPQRVTSDLPAQHSIASSLVRILRLDGASTVDSDADCEGKGGKATLLSRRLTTHLAALYPTRCNPTPATDSAALSTAPSIDPALLSPPASPSPTPPTPQPDAVPALETALLLLATRGTAPDAWVPARAAGEETAEGGGKGKGKGKSRGRGAGVRGASTARRKGRAGEDAEMLLDEGDTLPDVDSPPLDSSDAPAPSRRGSPPALPFSDPEDVDAAMASEGGQAGEGAWDEMAWLAD